MNILLNILWIVFGGFIICIEYVIASLLLMLTIVGIPFGLQTLKLAGLSLFPFGNEVRTLPSGGGCLNLVMNIIWVFVGGIEICLTHLALGVILSITIIGIPFGLQHFKLAGLAFTPFGRTVAEK